MLLLSLAAWHSHAGHTSASWPPIRWLRGMKGVMNAFPIPVSQSGVAL